MQKRRAKKKRNKSSKRIKNDIKHDETMRYIVGAVQRELRGEVRECGGCLCERRAAIDGEATASRREEGRNTQTSGMNGSDCNRSNSERAHANPCSAQQDRETRRPGEEVGAHTTREEPRGALCVRREEIPLCPTCNYYTFIYLL